MNFSIPVLNRVSKDDFVGFWSSFYGDSDADRVYLDNIDQPLTQERILELFKWKYGGRKMPAKIVESVKKKYQPDSFVPHSPSDYDKVIEFLKKHTTVIWPIFWLHCNNRDKFPIFDRHVYCAMRYLQNGKICNIDELSYSAQREVYLKEYIPFFDEFENDRDFRKVDRALVTFGAWLTTNKEKLITTLK
ncbi:hypothetical protein SAMN05660337_1793 [Maridesulfovibrio ferrireducens]|uniref:Uncharacterized protein n=1 Tax=Maridesulfovibrio ferrireducens TaxID=246191 RepID=A0A1G9G1G6_9BACT|nr:hypothetical protein [Maridesulfovibrio ferrireducens]SDK94466.1 hypothetical protein SAMN05660337_1793 [Maridesulfovibrio ferrireducens]